MSKFAPFNISTYTYKIINDHNILVDVLIPKDVKPGPRPVIYNIHGGYLVTGSRCFDGWMSQWLFDLALQESAIMVSGDYRLIPEANGLDILEDIDDLYEWVIKELPAIVSDKTNKQSTADLNRILITGGSAGGYLSIQMGLRQSQRKEYAPRAVISAYPVIGLDNPFFTNPHTDDQIPPRFAAPNADYIDAHIASTKPGTIISNSTPPNRSQLTTAIVFRGRLPTEISRGVDADKQYLLHPEERVKAGTPVPPLFIFHGLEDSGVPVEVSVNFVKLLKEAMPDVPVHLATCPGDHGFDDVASLEDAWMKEGIEFVKRWF